MSLNVKDPEAHRLAQAIAGATGETMTRAVHRLQQRNPEILAADIRAIAKRASARTKRPYLDHAEFLYDEHGLPK